jgi:hypothetical protein
MNLDLVVCYRKLPGFAIILETEINMRHSMAYLDLLYSIFARKSREIARQSAPDSSRSGSMPPESL